jgi:hypothetical protein
VTNFTTSLSTIEAKSGRSPFEKEKKERVWQDAGIKKEKTKKNISFDLTVIERIWEMKS